MHTTNNLHSAVGTFYAQVCHQPTVSLPAWINGETQKQTTGKGIFWRQHRCAHIYILWVK